VRSTLGKKHSIRGDGAGEGVGGGGGLTFMANRFTRFCHWDLGSMDKVTRWGSRGFGAPSSPFFAASLSSVAPACGASAGPAAWSIDRACSSEASLSAQACQSWDHGGSDWFGGTVAAFGCWTTAQDERATPAGEAAFCVKPCRVECFV